MILPDHEIRKYIAEGRIKVEPLDDPDLQIQPANIDLRLGNKFRIFKTISTPCIDTRKTPEHYTEEVIIEDGKAFILHPGDFVLGTVKEYIKVPNDLMGVVDGRSSMGRLGVVVHATSASINPGWEGQFVLEISNISKMAVALYPGQRVAKLAFHKLSSPCEKPYGERVGAKYQSKTDIEETKIFEEEK